MPPGPEPRVGDEAFRPGRGFRDPAARGVRRSAPSSPNAPATGPVAGWGSMPWRDEAAFLADDWRPRLADV